MDKKELLEMINSKLTDLSEDDIKVLINKELEKNTEEIDMDYIDLCYELLAIKKSNSQEKDIKVSNRRKIIPIRVLIAVAIIILFVGTTFTVSAYFFNFNIPQHIAQLIEGNAQIDPNLENTDKTADSYLLTDTDLAKQFAEYGIAPVTFPEEMIDEKCSIISIENMTTDESVQKDIYVRFEYLGTAGSLSIPQSSEEYDWVGEETVMDTDSADMIRANGMDIIIFERDNNCIILYQDNLTRYQIYLESELQTAIEFAKTIK